MNTLQIAVIGAHRGRSFVSQIQPDGIDAQLAGVCDIDVQALEPWRAEGIRCYDSFEQVLDDQRIDAVCIATPVRLHAAQAIAALDAGKHVLSEVTACTTLQEADDLIAAVERSGCCYMLAENYCFRRDVLLVQEMVERGAFGELTYAEGAYIHDCSDLAFDDAGDLTWRGLARQRALGNWYPTHSLGPVARWLAFGRQDRMLRTATWASPARAMAQYTARRFGVDHPLAAGDVWRKPDTVSTLVTSERGRLVNIRVDSASPRPHQMACYQLQGTDAAFVRDHSDAALIWLRDRSPTSPTGIAESWQPIDDFYDDFEHPLWRECGEQAARAGHGGGDFFVVREFISAIREQRLPLISVYDAVSWSSIIPLSQQSIEAGCAPVPVPDYHRRCADHRSQTAVAQR